MMENSKFPIRRGQPGDGQVRLRYDGTNDTIERCVTTQSGAFGERRSEIGSTVWLCIRKGADLFPSDLNQVRDHMG